MVVPHIIAIKYTGRVEEVVLVHKSGGKYSINGDANLAQMLRVYSILRVYWEYRVFFVLRVLRVLLIEYWQHKYSEYLEYEQY